MRTSIWDGPNYRKRGAKQLWNSPIPSIPCTPRWVSKTPNDIWFWNTMGLYIDTSRLKWIFWTSHHSVILIDMLLKLSRNLSTKTNGNSGLQIRNNQSMTKTALTNSLSKTSPRHKKRRVTGRQRRTPKMVWFPQNPMAQHRWMSLKTVISNQGRRQGAKPWFRIWF